MYTICITIRTFTQYAQYTHLHIHTHSHTHSHIDVQTRRVGVFLKMCIEVKREVQKKESSTKRERELKDGSVLLLGEMGKIDRE